MKKLAEFCYRRRWLVAGAWVALLVALNMLSGVAAGETSDDFRLPSSESQRALDLLTEAGFDSRTGEQIQIVFTAADLESAGAVHAPAVRSAMEGMFAAVESEIEGAEVVSPYDPAGQRQVSGDGTIAYAEVNLADRDADARGEVADQIERLRDAIAVDGLRVELGGAMYGEEAADDEGGLPSELIGVLAAVVILLIAFGSLFAMALPILVGLFGAGCGVAVLGLTANVIDMPSFASASAAMIAIGVGIDYALLVATRYREGLRDGLDPAEAVSTALGTAGRSVLFAGITVVIGVLGLLFMGLGLINGLAVGIAASVAMTMLASVTLLPALLGFTGRNIDRLSLPHRRRAGRRETAAARWARVIRRAPLPAGLAAFALLVVLAVPMLSLRLGFGDAGSQPESSTARRAYDLLSEGFGPGFNGPLLVAADLRGASNGATGGTANGATDGGVDGGVDGDAGGATAVADRLAAALAEADGVAYASPPILNPAGNAAIIQVVPTTAPQDEATTDLVHRLRDEVLPAAVAGTGAQAFVGGMNAAAIDYAEYTGDRLPLFVVVILGASFVLLTVVFRSLLVPLKAIVANMLAVGATFGVLVAVFQWGWGLDLLGFGRAGPIEAWAPMMIFAVVFGLSMDYEVFLVTRMREEFDRTGDAVGAVSESLTRTSRVITAAAAIMICVFGSFVLGDQLEMAILGFGLAFSILIDATVIRLVLVPAVMTLLGRRAWWLPAPLAAALPRLTIEGSQVPTHPDHPAPSAEPARTLEPSGPRVRT